MSGMVGGLTKTKEGEKILVSSLSISYGRIDLNMATDLKQIDLTEEQKRRVAELATQLGLPWPQVLEKCLSQPLEPSAAENFNEGYLEDDVSWFAHFNQWMNRQTSHNPLVDDSRASIYPDRG
jgi:hypothetical protein